MLSDGLGVREGDRVLDLCCGNGLIAQYLSEHCRSVAAVDVCSDLVERIDCESHPNIETVISDVREVRFDAGSFDKVLLYAGLQYLDEAEAIRLFERVGLWLAAGGVFYVGDIPDVHKRWVFFDTAERQSACFSAVKNGSPIIGTWFDAQFLDKLSSFSGFSQCRVVRQAPPLLYADFRFDMVFTK